MNLSMNKQKRLKDRVILSFTTIPSRINNVRSLLDSISNQVLRPDAVYMWICPYYSRLNTYFTDKEIPSFLNEYDFVDIKWCEDLGPFTKIYKVMEHEQDPDTIIVTADDEFSYPRYWLDGLTRMANEMPDCAIAYRGRRFKRNLIGIPLMEYNGSFLFECTQKLEKVDIITASFGAACRRKWFDRDFTQDWMRVTKGECTEMFYTDDIWVSGYLARKKIKRMVIPTTEGIIEKQGPDALGPMNWGKQTMKPEESNNQKSIRYFKKYW